MGTGRALWQWMPQSQALMTSDTPAITRPALRLLSSLYDVWMMPTWRPHAIRLGGAWAAAHPAPGSAAALSRIAPSSRPLSGMPGELLGRNVTARRPVSCMHAVQRASLWSCARSVIGHQATLNHCCIAWPRE
jgi:hypothetical protein